MSGNKKGEKLRYTEEERRERIRLIEEITGRPISEFYKTEAELGKMYGVEQLTTDDDPSDSRVKKKVTEYTEKKYTHRYCPDPYHEDEYQDLEEWEEEDPTLKPEENLLGNFISRSDQRIEELIYDVHRHDDKELSGYVNVIALMSVRFLIRRKIMKYGLWNSNNKEDAFNTCCAVILKQIDKYDPACGRLTTWVGSLLSRHLTNERIIAGRTLTVRSREENGLKINKAKAYLAERGIDDPTPQAIHRVITEVHHHIISLGTVQAYLKMNEQSLVSVDEESNAVNNLRSDFGNPEEEYLKKEYIQDIRNRISKMPRLERITLECAIEYMNKNGTFEKPSAQLVCKMVKELLDEESKGHTKGPVSPIRRVNRYGGITKAKINAAYKSAANILTLAYRSDTSINPGTKVKIPTKEELALEKEFQRRRFPSFVTPIFDYSEKDNEISTKEELALEKEFQRRRFPSFVTPIFDYFEKDDDGDGSESPTVK